MSIKTKIRNIIKNMTKNILFPMLFRWYCMRYPKVETSRVLFADAHHDSFPEDMKLLKDQISSRGYEVVELIRDFSELSLKESLAVVSEFMRYFATSGYVFLCDYYLPVISVKKRKQTKVIQLWHACGAYKKFGYDAEDDLGWMKNQNMFQNFDLVSVSSQACCEIYAKAFHISEEKVKPFGVSRTDRYFQKEFAESCRENFYKKYPDAKGKKILLWAPTFRKNAAEAGITGLNEMEWLEKQLGGEWMVLKKVHPHSEKKKRISNCDIATEQLYPVADLLITDYSSVVFDFSLTDKPILFFVPDKSDYEKERGFYVSLEEMPGKIIEEKEELYHCLNEGDYKIPKERYDRFKKKYLEKCDGHATERIIEWM